MADVLIDFVRAPEKAITPHPKAPEFSSYDSGVRFMKDLIRDIQSKHFQVTKTVVEGWRQTGLVSLWFFLKYIAGQTGPYDYLNDDLHLDMCNFRQSRHCLEPGAKAAFFLFRGASKSTIVTHGGFFWEATRDPNQRFIFINAKAERAHDFKNLIKVNVENNLLYQALYPEHCPDLDTRWNNNELVFKSRDRFWKEATFQASGIIGAKEGDHFTGIGWDDPVGLDALDSNENASLIMETAKKSFKTNTRALLIAPKYGRNLVAATFYSPDDLYVTEIVRKCKAVFGYNDPDIQPVPGGQWSIYYRSIIEDGRETCPFVMTKVEYEELLREAKWTALMQYANKYKAARASTGLQGNVTKCIVMRDTKDSWVIIRPGDQNFDEDSKIVKLEDCSVCMSIDPAGTDHKASSHTARTSIGVWAMDGEEHIYRIFSAVGYFSDTEMYDRIFEGHELYRGYIHNTIFETNALQNVLVRNLEREMEKRQIFFSIERKPETGDKKARIRHTVGHYVAQDKVHMAEGCGREFLEEMYIFPGGANATLDVLDEAQKAMAWLRKPSTEVEKYDLEEEEEIEQYEYAANLFGKW